MGYFDSEIAKGAVHRFSLSFTMLSILQVFRRSLIPINTKVIV